MKLQKIVSRLQKLHPKEIDLSLDRIQNLCKKLGNPQDKLKAISVVGTNGKYSTIQAMFAILKEARKKTGVKCSMVVSTGSINNIKITAIASDFDFLGASIEAAEGEAILFAAQYSIENKQPLLICTSGGGMRMQASMISLNQMPRAILAINEIKKNNLPYLVLLTDPTAGSITASYAMVGDIHIAEPSALVAFAGARVIQGTVKEELPIGFQTSEYLEKTGFVDLIVDRKDLSEKIGTLLSILLKKNSVISTVENETTENTQSLSKVAS